LSNRKSQIDNRKWTIVVAVCILSCIAGAAYTKTDRTVILLSTDSRPQTQDSGSKVELASPVSVEVSEPSREQAAQWQTVRMRVTGYCPCPKCCGEYSDGVTANGHKVQPGDTFVAADKRFAFGTEMVIPGYNNGRPVKVLDRGGAIRGNKLDAFFYTHQQALEWGVHYLDVQVRVN
jgi:3D (Asp-Asp-Asp) domain-containing protein